MRHEVAVNIEIFASDVIAITEFIANAIRTLLIMVASGAVLATVFNCNEAFARQFRV